MNNLKWFFPETETECLRLIKDGYKPHGGGTFLIKTPLNIKGLFTLPDNGTFHSCRRESETLIIGGAVSYTEAAAFLENECSGNFITKAFGSAASTPLRNRITVGGSINAAPKWSDITGSLTAAKAVLKLAGIESRVGIEEYLTDSKLRKGSLISSVEIRLSTCSGDYCRCTLTGFDYPFFTIAVSTAGSGFFCAVSGTGEGVISFSGNADTILTSAAGRLSFNNERGFSSEYLKNRALTELKRIIGGLRNE